MGVGIRRRKKGGREGTKEERGVKWTRKCTQHMLGAWLTSSDFALPWDTVSVIMIAFIFLLGLWSKECAQGVKNMGRNPDLNSHS